MAHIPKFPCNTEKGFVGKHKRLYNIWRKMLDRVYDENHIKYKYYGGRGIKSEYAPWKKGFKGFVDDMGESYYQHIQMFLDQGYDLKYAEMNTTLDRIDNNGDYCKENLRWCTRVEQSTNRNCMKGREFLAYSPDGKIYLSNNIRAFCRNHNLDTNRTSVNRHLKYGDLGKCSGWNFKYRDPVSLPIDVIKELY